MLLVDSHAQVEHRIIKTDTARCSKKALVERQPRYRRRCNTPPMARQRLLLNRYVQVKHSTDCCRTDTSRDSIVCCRRDTSWGSTGYCRTDTSMYSAGCCRTSRESIGCCVGQTRPNSAQAADNRHVQGQHRLLQHARHVWATRTGIGQDAVGQTVPAQITEIRQKKDEFFTLCFKLVSVSPNTETC